MGKRKGRKAPPKRIIPKVPTSFDCPFCNHELTVECKMYLNTTIQRLTIYRDRQRSIGTVSCRICGAAYQTRIHYLSDPIDVYSEWIDEAQKINEPEDVQEEEEEEEHQLEETTEVQDTRAQEEEEDEEEQDEFLRKHEDVSSEESSDDE